MSQLKNLFGFLEGLWTPSLLCLNLCMVCILCDVCVDVVGGLRGKNNIFKQIKKRKGIWRIDILRFCFSAPNKQQQTHVWLCKEFDHCYCFYVVWLHWLTNNKSLWAHLQNVEGNMTTLNSTTLVSSKEKKKYCQFAHTSISTAKCLKVCERLWVLLLFWLLIPTSVSQYNKGCLKRHCFLSVETAPTHIKTRDAIHVCPAAICPQVWFIQLMQKGEDYFHTNKQNWLEQQPTQVSSSFLLDKQTQRIPKLSNVWILSKTMHMKLSILTVSLKVTPTSPAKHFVLCLGKNEQLCTFVTFCFKLFHHCNMCVGLLIFLGLKIHKSLLFRLMMIVSFVLKIWLGFCKLRHLEVHLCWSVCHVSQMSFVFNKKKKKQNKITRTKLTTFETSRGNEVNPKAKIKMV